MLICAIPSNKYQGSTDGAVLDHDQPRNKSKGKRKAADRPDVSSKEAKKWAWTPEAVELLLKYIKEYIQVTTRWLRVSAALLAEIAQG